MSKKRGKKSGRPGYDPILCPNCEKLFMNRKRNKSYVLGCPSCGVALIFPGEYFNNSEEMVKGFHFLPERGWVLISELLKEKDIPQIKNYRKK